MKNKGKGWLLAAACCIAAALAGTYACASENSADSGRQSEKETAAKAETIEEKETEEEYPASLLDFVERYPEAEPFLLGYAEKKDLHEEIDLSGEVTKGDIPLFLQWDPRWGYEIYGSDMMGITGCGPTCLSMVICGLSGQTDWNPYEVAQMAQEKGYYVKGVGSSWDLMSKGAKRLGLKVHEISLDKAEIEDAFTAGRVMICSVKPGDFTDAGHFIVLSGMEEDGSIAVRDPNSRINSEKTWDIDTLLSQIKGIWSYSYEEE